ncbi:CKLF-like MARVEL transmembrane domain-containing protein 2 isoform X2 [Nannospalax galili]|uniref:CKLF-like MARVEL transmembrane domain-containing protein 2 isoform X2 n=1 Tax=Nannospalax galili TaxID=1026970 RepID=UPI00111C8D57|nr:CKLF-like MARVEL transmembrane domain-containing protein 2 isoform X2 [Nannospalax galili]
MTDAPKRRPVREPKDEVGARKGFGRYKWEFKDSNREFWVMGHAPLKILTLGCLIAGLFLFDTVATHPILILVLSMEVSIFIFFVVLNTFAVHRYMPFILWPAAEKEVAEKLFSTDE